MLYTALKQVSGLQLCDFRKTVLRAKLYEIVRCSKIKKRGMKRCLEEPEGLQYKTFGDETQKLIPGLKSMRLFTKNI